MRKLFLLLAAALFAAPSPAKADDPTGPTVEVRIQAIKDMLPLASYIGDLVGQGEPAEQGVNLVKALAGKKGVIEGVDITRPIGAYAVMTPAVIDSPIVVMVPVGDEAAFLNLLRGKLSLNPEKGDDDVYAVDVPNVPPKVYFRFHKDYVCVAVHNKKSLDPKTLPNPKEFFAKEDAAVLSVAVHLDRVPADVRKTVLGQMELKFADEKGKPAKSPAEEKARALALDAALSGFTAVSTEGRTATLRLTLDPKADDIGLALTLTGKDGSDLKSLFSAAATRTAVAPLAAAKDAVLSFAANLQVPEKFQKRFADAIDLAIGESLENAKGNDREGAKRFFDAIEPTLKSGVVQFGASLTSSAADKFELLGAVRMTGGKEIEKLAREFAPHIPENQAKVKFDVEKAGSTPLHEVVPTLEEKAEKLFGKNSSVWLTTADDLFVAGFGSNSAAVKKVAQASPAAVPIFSFEASLARLLPVVEEKLKPEQVRSLVKEVFDDVKPAGNDTVKFAVTGGEKLSVSLTAKGKALKLLALLDKRKKES
ncbi:hypothetical protein [Limnoglobus roseus]|uniref:Uncharacterized protein n=1 Tax=Limnoglobus roseus TaxID=2598579 RepID=A0A5C1A9E5_9BACT|nr:hypothetical protein [Limnoglobus roseus]QEL15989.1 hypothetical protein PX52LOC_02926 [Limnoglobus roseus]